MPDTNATTNAIATFGDFSVIENPDWTAAEADDYSRYLILDADGDEHAGYDDLADAKVDAAEYAEQAAEEAADERKSDLRYELADLIEDCQDETMLLAIKAMLAK